MRNWTLALTAASLLLGGCSGPGNHYVVTMDGLSPQMQTAVTSGLADWEANIPEVSFETRVGPCSGVQQGQICIHAATLEQLVAAGGQATYTGYTAWRYDTAVTRVDGGEVWLDIARIEMASQQFPDAARTTAEHEVGHAMGLKHLQNKVLMNANLADGAAAPTCADVSEWYQVRGMQPVCE